MTKTQSRRQRARRLLVVAFMVVTTISVVASPALAAAPDAGVQPATTPDATTTDHTTFALADQSRSLQENETSTPENESDSSGDGPTAASQVRINPIPSDEPYLSVKVVEAEQTYNTTGPSALFELTEPVDAARIQQSNAEATVLGSGDVIRVEYTDDAAPPNSQSLYALELYFTDGSERTIDLYATKTAVSVEAAQYSQWVPVIEWIQQHADDYGYEDNPEAALNFLQYLQDRADLLENLFSERVGQFIALRIADMMNPVSWAVLFAGLAAIAIWMEHQHGWVVRTMLNAVSEGEMMHEALRQEYERNRNAAAKHKLGDVEEIGPNATLYWRHLGVETVDDMVETACKGWVDVDPDGNIIRDENGTPQLVHHGVGDLTKIEEPTRQQYRDKTWLKPLLIQNRLSLATVLSNIEAALDVAARKYNRGNEVRKTRKQVRELLRRVQADREHQIPTDAGSISTSAARRHRDGTTGTGGD